MTLRKPLVLGPTGWEQLQSGDALTTGSSPYLTQGDIANDLTTNDALKVLSAAQGKLLYETAQQLDVRNVADEDAMVVDAAAEPDSNNVRYLVKADSTNNGNAVVYLCTEDVSPGETLFSGNNSKFIVTQLLDVQILETELSSATNSTSTTIAFNLAGAKSLKDEIDTLSGGAAGLQPKTEIIQITAQHVSDGFFLINKTPVNTQHPIMFVDQGAIQTGKEQVTINSGSPSIDFEIDTVVKKRVYIRNKAADHDGQGTVEHTGLAESIAENNIVVMFYLHTGS